MQRTSTPGVHVQQLRMRPNVYNKKRDQIPESKDLASRISRLPPRTAQTTRV